MLTLLGLLTVVGLLVLILGRVTSVPVALVLVPVAAALVGGFGRDVGAFAMEGIRSVTPVAAMLAFAVVYFGVMNDVGLFDPLIRGVLRLVQGNPVRIAIGTAVLAMLSHLDGAGASTFMVTVPAMLPIYRAVGMDIRLLTSITALAAGTMNMLPWAGPITRAASVLQSGTSALFLPLVPSMLTGLVVVLVLAAGLGRRERARLARVGSNASDQPQPNAVAAREPRHDHANAEASPSRSGSAVWPVNAVLTLAVLIALFTEVVPLAVAFVVASAVALVVNFPRAQDQRDRLAAHANAAMLMLTTIFAAGVFTGIVTKSGMLGAMSSDLVRALPDGALGHLPLLVAVTSMPLSLVFDPDSFYFGMLPVLAKAAEAAGASSMDVARAATLGQMTTGFPVSPLTPSTFLLVGLAGVDFADHQRRTIPFAFAVTLVMTVVAWVTGAIRF